MKSLKLVGAAVVAGVLYGSTVAFSPIKKSADTKNIIFETNDINEVRRVKDLLTQKNLQEVEQLASNFKLFKMRLRVLPRPIGLDKRHPLEGTTIDLEGGKQ